MKPLAALAVGAMIGLAITASLSYALARWGDAALVHLDRRSP